MHLSVDPNERVQYMLRHEDEHCAVVDKPVNVVTQPGKGHEDDSLLNGLFARWGPRLQKLGKDRDFGLLHRLDRETSGLVVVGLSPEGYDGLRAQFEERRIRKFYLCVTADPPKAPTGVIKKPLAEFTAPSPADREGKKIVKMARISKSGKPALTAYRVLETSNLGTLVECRPVTGRLHQVRVHMASIGCPILGDGFYGSAKTKSVRTRLALHSHRVVFLHPVTGEMMDVRSPFPKDLRGLLAKLKLSPPDTSVKSVEALGEPEDGAVGE